MKFIKTREENLSENYLELHYDDIDSETAAVLERLRPALKYIDTCLEVKETLQSIIDDHKDAGFVRISKSCIANMYKIKRLQGDLNMRTLIYLKNDECLVMNRGYRAEFYEALERLRGRKKNETHK